MNWEWPDFATGLLVGLCLGAVIGVLATFGMFRAVRLLNPHNRTGREIALAVNPPIEAPALQPPFASPSA